MLIIQESTQVSPTFVTYNLKSLAIYWQTSSLDDIGVITVTVMAALNMYSNFMSFTLSVYSPCS